MRPLFTILVLLIAAIIGLAIVAAEPLLNSVAVKSQIEKSVGETLKMNFKIEGRIKLDYFPSLSVGINQINIRTSKGTIASAARIEIDPRLTDLFFLRIHLDDVRIHTPQLTFDPHALENVLALTDGASGKPLPVASLLIDSFSVFKAKFYYSDKRSVVDLKEMNFEGGQIAIIDDHRFIIDGVESFFRAVNFKGTLSAQQIISKKFKLTHLKAQAKGEKGLLTFDPIELEYSGSAATLRATLDFSKNNPSLQSQLNLSGLNIRSLLQAYHPDMNIKGKANVTADIAATGIQFKDLIGRRQAISDADKPGADAAFPVNKAVINSLMVSASNLKITRGTAKVDNAKVALTGSRLSVIEKNKIIIKDLKTLIRNAKFDAKAQIKRLSVGKEKFSNVKFSVRGDQGILKSDSIEFNYFSARAKLTGVFNMQDRLNHLKIRVEMPRVDLEQFFKESGAADIVKGTIDVESDFEARRAFDGGIIKNASGDISIKGQDLILKGIDLDKALDKFKKIRGYGVFDFSTFLLIGPLGTIVSSGYGQLEAYNKIVTATGDSAIKQVVSDWNLAAGVVTAKDVAFSTERNRMALKGGLDIANRQFNQLTIAVVDSKGCSLNSETVDGSFANPTVKDTGVIERTIIRPLQKSLETKCDLFYSGTVPHPAAGQAPSGQK